MNKCRSVEEKKIKIIIFQKAYNQKQQPEA
jgi:hypothetical protein